MEEQIIRGDKSAAKFLDISLSTLKRWDSEVKIPCRVTYGCRRSYLKTELLRWYELMTEKMRSKVERQREIKAEWAAYARSHKKTACS